MYILRIRNEKLLRQDCVVSMISPYISKTGKSRLIEPPRSELKIVQKRIKTLLGKIDIPDFLVLKENLILITQNFIWEIVGGIYIK